MDKLFAAITRDPLSVLPDKSILMLEHFRAAYYARLKMEGINSEMPSVLKHFEKWLHARFSVGPTPQGAFQLVRSYSNGDEDALDRFFALLLEFQKEGVPSAQAYDDPFRPIPKIDLVSLIRKMRKNPVIYVGHAHFAGFNAYLCGHMHGGVDVGLSRTADEQLFEDFKRWVEQTKNQNAQNRPWFRIVSFYSSCDCGHLPGGAYNVFLRWLDEFSDEIGKPGVFRPDA